jgi:MFS family permease
VLAALLLSTACLAVGMGMTQPTINALISHQAGAHEQGEVMGVSQSLGSLARILGPAFAGVCFADIGRNAPYVAGAILMAFAVALAVHLAREIASAAEYELPPKTRHAP